jgi:hypothetical protein
MTQRRHEIELNKPFGPSVASAEDWNELVELGRYLAVCRRNRSKTSGKVKAVALFINTPEDARRGVRRSD